MLQKISLALLGTTAVVMSANPASAVTLQVKLARSLAMLMLKLSPLTMAPQMILMDLLLTLILLVTLFKVAYLVNTPHLMGITPNF